ncbi:hypothetical protein M758_2G160700 [Ceratodon purpureus]|nr:hypothetical protein M758_2G160300 [Ceratodon purpureus]KAG0626907.1 hypothetical protein M758_2G160700 [Ceratodon purpureus]
MHKVRNPLLFLFYPLLLGAIFVQSERVNSLELRVRCTLRTGILSIRIQSAFEYVVVWTVHNIMSTFGKVYLLGCVSSGFLDFEGGLHKSPCWYQAGNVLHMDYHAVFTQGVLFLTKMNFL